MKMNLVISFLLEHDRKRIWQPDEIALFVYFSRLLSLNLEIMTLKSKVK